MKRLLQCVVVVTSFLLLGGISFVAYAGTNSLTLPTLSVPVGQSQGAFGIILANEDTPSALEVTFRYDPTIGFDVTGVMPGARTAEQFEVSPMKKTEIDSTTTEIRVALYKLGLPAPILEAGTGEIFEFTYSMAATVAGETPLPFINALLADSAGEALGEVVLQDGKVIVELSPVTPTGTPTAVPEPATFGLFGFGVAGMVYLVRRARRQR